MLVEYQLFSWYLGAGICVGMHDGPQTLGSQQLHIHNLDSLPLLSLSRTSWCCCDIFTLWVLTPYCKLQGLRNFSPMDCTHLNRPFALLCFFSLFKVIFKEALVNIFPHSKSMWLNFQNWATSTGENVEIYLVGKEPLVCFLSYFLSCVSNTM